MIWGKSTSASDSLEPETFPLTLTGLIMLIWLNVATSPKITLRCTAITVRIKEEWQLLTHTNILAQENILTGSTMRQSPSVRIKLHPCFCGSAEITGFKNPRITGWFKFLQTTQHGVDQSHCPATRVICYCMLDRVPPLLLISILYVLFGWSTF